ncbi:MAG: hypothetical protein QOE36_3317, partial [Gaiellaceae bacterium]|nr:hypothetical protein [Gaiellaceae bacterium]
MTVAAYPVDPAVVLEEKRTAIWRPDGVTDSSAGTAAGEERPRVGAVRADEHHAIALTVDAPE